MRDGSSKPKCSRTSDETFCSTRSSPLFDVLRVNLSTLDGAFRLQGIAGVRCARAEENDDWANPGANFLLADPLYATMTTLKKRRKIQRPYKSYTAVFEVAEEGGYIVHIPALRGCATQGETFEEAEKNAQEAIEGYLQVLREMHEEIPVESDQTIVARIPAFAT